MVSPCHSRSKGRGSGIHNVSTRISSYAQKGRFVNVLLAAMLLAQSMFGGLPIDGISCEQMEGAVEHVHAHVQLFDRGRAVMVPAYIGMSSTSRCLYWLHTHSTNGI